MSDILVVLVIALIAVLVWRGPKTLPGIGAALGRGVKEARKEASQFREGETAPTAPTAPTTPPDDRPA